MNATELRKVELVMEKGKNSERKKMIITQDEK